MYDSGEITTELIWSGKRKEMEAIPILPFQYIETINEPRAKKIDNYLNLNDEKWYNLLIWGDNLFVMKALLEKFAGKINLIYIDPPFATGADFSMPIEIEGEEFEKEPSVIEIKAYRDTWGQGLASYLQMMYDRLVLMRELLADNGTIYVHMDRHVGHYVKVIMDEIFGKENFRNELVWCYTGPGRQEKDFPDKHDVIYRYSRSDNYVFKPDEIRIPYVKLDTGKTHGIFKKRAILNKEGKIPEDWWSDITPVARLHATELLGFPTQKPEALLERIIKASSNEGDLVADFFCGSGTTLAVAEKLNRRWIGVDLSKYAIHITRKRLLEIPGCRPFHILNLGKYQKYMLTKNGNGGTKYIKFILELYNATPIMGYAYIHGRKEDRLVSVGPIDSFVSVQYVRQIAREAENLNASGIDILGWDFEMGLYDLLDDIKKDYGKDIKLKQIPNSVLDIDLKKSKLMEEVKFFDMNYIDIGYALNNREIKVFIKKFILANPEYIPEEIRNNIRDSKSLIDYWAIDFNYKGDTFHNMRQEYRTKKNPDLKTTITYQYTEPGEYDILVKVVDIFGNDTNKLLKVSVK